MSSDDVFFEVWTCERKVDERTVIGVRRWRGTWFLDFRVQYFAPDRTWRPTQKGVSFRLAQLAGFAAAVTKAISMLEARVGTPSADRRQGDA